MKAFFFPGQGSQKVGMMEKLKPLKSVQKIFQTAKEVLGVDFLQLLEPNFEDKAAQEQILQNTFYVQPLMLTVGFATFQAYREVAQFKQGIFAGHSLGEWTALVCAGAVEFSEALVLVQNRARLMQEAFSQKGGLAAVLGLSREIVEQMCQKAEMQTQEVVAAVNFNTPEQTVIAGTETALKLATELLLTAGAKKVQHLNVSVPSHCRLMSGAVAPFRELLVKSKLKLPEFPLIHNYSSKIATTQEELIENLALQIANPVRWVELVQTCSAQVDEFLEIAPTDVLTRMNRRIAPGTKSTSLLLWSGAKLD